jgi:hypothetical protein
MTLVAVAVMEPSLLTSGRSDSSAAVPSMLRTRKISVTKLFALPRRPALRLAEEAAPAVGWMRKAPPEIGTAISRWREGWRGTARNIRIETGPLGHHRDFALHGGVDHEGAARHPRRVLDKGAHVGFAKLTVYCAMAGASGTAADAKARPIRKRFKGCSSTEVW